MHSAPSLVLLTCAGTCIKLTKFCKTAMLPKCLCACVPTMQDSHIRDHMLCLCHICVGVVDFCRHTNQALRNDCIVVDLLARLRPCTNVVSDGATLCCFTKKLSKASIRETKKMSVLECLYSTRDTRDMCVFSGVQTHLALFETLPAPLETCLALSQTACSQQRSCQPALEINSAPYKTDTVSA